METWALFVDLVKAFDSVPREALFSVLRRFGVPDHFVNVIIRLHNNAMIKVPFHNASGVGDDELACVKASIQNLRKWSDNGRTNRAQTRGINI